MLTQAKHLILSSMVNGQRVRYRQELLQLIRGNDIRPSRTHEVELNISKALCVSP